jgi:hypothetical protein
VDERTLRYYREGRRKGTPARYALDYAKWRTAKPEHDWSSTRSGDSVAEWTQGRYGIRARVTPDYEKPFDAGTFSETRTPGAIRVPRPDGWRWHVRFDDYGRAIPCYFESATGGPEEHRAEYRRMGYSRHDAWTRAIETLREEAQRHPEPQFDVSVSVTLGGVVLAKGSVCFSADYDTAEAYAEDCATDLLYDLIPEADEKLASLVALA